MPSRKIITPILGGSFYHIFNRGINRQILFYQIRNYEYFLRLIDQFLSDYIHLLAYCLLPNHFHLVLKVKEKILLNGEEKSDEESIGSTVVQQLKRLFVTYSMAINKQEHREGILFDPKYKRIEIEDDDYLLYAIYYTHYNPEKHQISRNFRLYEHSSYNAICEGNKSIVDRKYLLELFDDLHGFITYHNMLYAEKGEIDLE
jgi:REP element-mobilizing transposase RayT